MIFLSTVVIRASDEPVRMAAYIFSTVKDSEPALCPVGMSYSDQGRDSFCIDTYTASAGEDCPYSAVQNAGQTRINLEEKDCLAESRPWVMPWRYINQSQAKRACAEVGKRLLSSAEWYRAGLVTSSIGEGLADCHLFSQWSETPGLTATGKNCHSGAGVYDLVGNVWEWVDETVVDGRLNDQELPPSGFITAVDNHGTPIATDPGHPDLDHGEDRLWLNEEGVRGVMRGGFFGSGRDGGVYSFHAEMTPDFAGRAVGFRCVTTPLR